MVGGKFFWRKGLRHLEEKKIPELYSFKNFKRELVPQTNSRLKID